MKDTLGLSTSCACSPRGSRCSVYSCAATTRPWRTTWPAEPSVVETVLDRNHRALRRLPVPLVAAVVPCQQRPSIPPAHRSFLQLLLHPLTVPFYSSSLAGSRASRLSAMDTMPRKKPSSSPDSARSCCSSSVYSSCSFLRTGTAWWKAAWQAGKTVSMATRTFSRLSWPGTCRREGMKAHHPDSTMASCSATLPTSKRRE